MTTKEQLTALSDQACELASLIEGLSVVHDTLLQGGSGSIIEKRASGSLGPMFDAVIEKAWALNSAIGDAEKQA